jgi:hypothetical protein
MFAMFDAKYDMYIIFYERLSHCYALSGIIARITIAAMGRNRRWATPIASVLRPVGAIEI